jgi:hypothetical protein
VRALVAFAIFILIAAGGGYLAYIGAFYPTGRQYYEVCWTKKNAEQSHAAVQSHAPDAYQDVIWGNCDSIAERVIYASGMLTNNQDKDEIALRAVCPELLYWYSWEIIDAVRASGGPTLVDAITPAEWMIGRIAKARWPKCDEERRRLGYPKVVETKPGEFGWAEVCAPCEARKRQEAKKEEEFCKNVRAEPKRWTIVTPSQLDLRNLRIERSDTTGHYNVSGSIRNNATVSISAVELNVTAYDCPTRNTPVAACNVIGHASDPLATIVGARNLGDYVDLPPGKVGEIGGSVNFTNLPAPRGLLSWTIVVSKVRAPLDASDRFSAGEMTYADLIDCK